MKQEVESPKHDFADVGKMVAALRKENKNLKAVIEKECKEHQKAMLVADKTIKTLDKALELACETMDIPKGYCIDRKGAKCPAKNCAECMIAHFKIMAGEQVRKDDLTQIGRRRVLGKGGQK